MVLLNMVLQGLFAVRLKGAEGAFLSVVFVSIMKVAVGSDDLDGAIVLIFLLVFLHVAFPLCGGAALITDVGLLLRVKCLVTAQFGRAVCHEGAVEAVVLPLIDEAVEYHGWMLSSLLRLGGGCGGR